MLPLRNSWLRASDQDVTSPESPDKQEMMKGLVNSLDLSMLTKHTRPGFSFLKQTHTSPYEGEQ